MINGKEEPTANGNKEPAANGDKEPVAIKKHPVVKSAPCALPKKAKKEHINWAKGVHHACVWCVISACDECGLCPACVPMCVVVANCGVRLCNVVCGCAPGCMLPRRWVKSEWPCPHASFRRAVAQAFVGGAAVPPPIAKQPDRPT